MGGILKFTILVILTITGVLFYQNCSQKFEANQGVEDLKSLDTDNDIVVRPSDVESAALIRFIKPDPISTQNYFLFEFSIKDSFKAKSVDCKLDGEEFKPCDSLTNHKVTHLSDGSHMFILKITDAKGKYVQETCRWTIHSQNNLVLSSPQEWQVHQRNLKDLGFVRVSGLAPKEMLSLKVEVFNETRTRVKLTKLNRNELNMKGEIFDKTFSLTKGGWYQLVASALGPNEMVLSKAIVEHIGVGEVFVTAGQSNSFWSGEQAVPTAANVSFAHFSMGDYIWRKNIDPNPNRGSAWPSFANQLAKHLGVPVAVTMLGCGGTALQQWLPPNDVEAEAVNNVCEASLPGDLYKRLYQAIHKIGHFRAILWHQGESDTIRKTKRAAYQVRFLKIMMQMHQDLGRVVPWFIAKASYFPSSEVELTHCNKTGSGYGRKVYMTEVRVAQRNLWQQKFVFEGPDTDPYFGSPYRYPGDRGGCVHFSKQGLIVHGTLWFRSVLAAGIIPTQ